LLWFFFSRKEESQRQLAKVTQDIRSLKETLEREEANLSETKERLRKAEEEQAKPILVKIVSFVFQAVTNPAVVLAKLIADLTLNVYITRLEIERLQERKNNVEQQCNEARRKREDAIAAICKASKSIEEVRRNFEEVS
jgi:hypothetical protein